MNPTHKSLRQLGIYFSVLLFSIGIFYTVDGKFETDGWFSVPTGWTLWFYILYLVIPFITLTRLIFRILIKRKPITQSLNSVVFIIGFSIIAVSYWLIVNYYKMSLYQDFKTTQNKMKNEINTISLTNINSQFEFNKHNKNRSYKVMFTQPKKLTHKTTANIKGFIEDKEKDVYSPSLTLYLDKVNQEYHFDIVESSLRNIATSKDTLGFKVSYTVDFPRDIYKPRAELAQQLCTWSIIQCSNTGKEAAWHDTELFDSTIFMLPYKINSSETPLIKVKLSEFTNIDTPLPFSNISFLTEEATLKNGIIDKFILKFNVDSRIDGHIYNQMVSSTHSNKLYNMISEHKGLISKGKNIISIPVDLNELSTLMNKQTESGKIEFELFISNNRGWYCPNFICEIINNPSQFKRFVVTTKNNYHADNFPKMKPKKRIMYYPKGGQRGDIN